uniref:AI-2E family transporter n=1 Tax=Noctiluca scintillans TaxID=2966 RepID=A0A7S1AKX7_NOCSC|mmetsp:Transcript_50557/g.134508  ORF Transcript_50557/g.134508 Transcript_50557/m.134508 type:complete len:529 (+) Transcript_50557:84-1670(+)
MGVERLYGFKIALAVIVMHFSVLMMQQFADILLPFIMALLLVSILEPIKQLTLTVMEGSLVLFFERCRCGGCCLRHKRRRLRSSEGAARPQPLDLHETVKRIFTVIAICFTLFVAGRIFWIVGRIVWLSAEAIINDFEYYQLGAEKRQKQIKALLERFGLEEKVRFDWEHAAQWTLSFIKVAAQFVSQNAFYAISQVGMTSIFALFLLYSPPMRDFSEAMGEVFSSMENYLKLKTMISATMGVTNGVALFVIGLELPAAWGLMTFLANFIPYVGAPIVSTVPCIIALLDIRKSLYQVCAAFVGQLFLHMNISNFVEPIVFEMSEDVHSVVVLLGLSFFSYVWGIAGMFLGVPLLSATRAWMRVVDKTPSFSVEAREDARFIMGMLEGRWLADVESSEAQVGILTGDIELNPVDDSLLEEGSLELLGREENDDSTLEIVRKPSYIPQNEDTQLRTCEFFFKLRDDDGMIIPKGLFMRWMLLGCICVGLLPRVMNPALLINAGSSSGVEQYDNYTLSNDTGVITTTSVER